MKYNLVLRESLNHLIYSTRQTQQEFAEFATHWCGGAILVRDQIEKQVVGQWVLSKVFEPLGIFVTTKELERTNWVLENILQAYICDNYVFECYSWDIDKVDPFDHTLLDGIAFPIL